MLGLIGFRPPKRSAGITLLELMVVVVVLVVLATMAVPALQNTIKNNRITAQTNELITLINLARNEAIRRNVDGVSLRSVLSLEINGDVWTANVDVTGGEPGEGCPAGVIRCASHGNVVLSGAEEFSFNNRGYMIEAGETWAPRSICLKHTSCSDPLQHREVRVLPSGQVESIRLGCDDTCPSGD